MYIYMLVYLFNCDPPAPPLYRFERATAVDITFSEGACRCERAARQRECTCNRTGTHSRQQDQTATYNRKSRKSRVTLTYIRQQDQAAMCNRKPRAHIYTGVRAYIILSNRSYFGIVSLAPL